MIQIDGLKMNNINYILLVDKNYNIIFNARYDPRFSAAPYSSFHKNINFFDMYPSIKKEESSIVECMNSGEIVVRKSQRYLDYSGKVYMIHSINIPIMMHGQVLGVVELAKDVTTVNNGGDIEKKPCKPRKKITGYSQEEAFKSVLTINPYMLKNIERAKILATTPNPTLVYGETGTGKEVFIQAMIQYSKIASHKVVVQNCAAVPDNLIESILFGTIKGSYTGAEDHKGLFEQADGGILFLDELNAMHYHVQGKLLRVIQDGSFRPVGSSVEKKINVKVIATINMEPTEAIEKKQLRNDLFYRFSSSMIKLLPLRERKEDIPYYVSFYLTHFNEAYGKQVQGITDQLAYLFQEYEWEGNVRELKHIVESMVCIAEDTMLDIQHLPAYFYDRIEAKRNSQGAQRKDDSLYSATSLIANQEFDLRNILDNTEKQMIQKALQSAGGNQTKAAELLGITRQTLRYKIGKYNL